MKNNLKIIVIFLATAAMLTSCIVYRGTKDEYFGYNNSPRVQDNTQNPNQNGNSVGSAGSSWVNPLRDDYDNRDNYQVSYSGFNAQPYFITVVAPWWDVYYPRRFSPYYSYYWDPFFTWQYNWYSPWYSYCPIYFSSYDHFYYRNHYWGNNSWRHDYRHDNDRPRYANRDIRDFGPSKGLSRKDNTPFFGGSSSKTTRSNESKGTAQKSTLKNQPRSGETPKISFTPKTITTNDSYQKGYTQRSQPSTKNVFNVPKETYNNSGTSFKGSSGGGSSPSSGSNGGGSSSGSSSKSSGSGSGSSSKSSRSGK